MTSSCNAIQLPLPIEQQRVTELAGLTAHEKVAPDTTIQSAKILYVEDDDRAARAILRALAHELPECSVKHVNSVHGILPSIQSLQPEVVILDLSLTPDNRPSDGIEQISAILRVDPTTQIIALTGHGGDELANEAFDRGATSYLIKPASIMELVSLMSDRIATARVRRRHQTSIQISTQVETGSFELSQPPTYSMIGYSLIGNSQALQHLASQVRFAASNRLPVLLLGETGTGKNVLARTIHSAQRSGSNPFVRYSPSFGSQDHVISELFGHSRGAYTGATEERRGVIEDANHGTLFLDEVAELPTPVQILLLDTLQNKEFRRLGSNRTLRSDFRYIAATNVSLANLKQRVRPDFLFRTSHIIIHLPSLRERREDIPDLARGLFDRYSRATKCNVYSISRSSLALLQSLSWPGNIRELQAAVETATARAHFMSAKTVRPEHFQFEDNFTQLPHSFRGRVKRFEESLIAEALEETGGNQQQAASLLKIDRSLLRRIQARMEIR